MPGRNRITWPGACEGSEAMKKKPIVMPKFANEGEEADWWASPEGPRVREAESGRKREEGRCAEGFAPGQPADQDCQRPSRVAIART
jgi:hypothetical protein